MKNMLTFFIFFLVLFYFLTYVFTPYFSRPFSPTLENLNTYTLIPYFIETNTHHNTHHAIHHACYLPCQIYSPSNTHSGTTIDITTDITKNTLISVKEFVHAIRHKKPYTHALIALNQKKEPTVSHLLALKNIAENSLLGDRVVIYSRGYTLKPHPLSNSCSENSFTCLQNQFCILFNNLNTHKSDGAGNGIIAAYTHIRDHLIHVPCITFDRPETHRYFSFGQDLDISCFNTVYDALLKKNPHIRITLMGDCLGGLVGLRFIARYPEKAANIDTIVLESPFVSAHDFFDHVPHSIHASISKKTGYTVSLPFIKKVIHTLVPWWFYTYNPSQDTLDTNAIKHKNIFIGYYPADFLISPHAIHTLVSDLSVHNNVSFLSLLPTQFEGTPPLHCNLSSSPAFQQAVNAFFRHHNQAHNPKVASLGAYFI